MPTEKIQKSSEGVGPLYHRLYRVEFPATEEQAYAAMLDVQKDPNQFSPQLIASFVKKSGAANSMQPGDEYDVRLSAPWQAPVRVLEVKKDSFTLATLEGHIECGRIQFRVEKVGEGQWLFSIESLARSKDSIVNFLYDKLPIARFAQTQMWERFCDSFAKAATGPEAVFEVEVLTEKKDEGGKWESI